MHKFLKVIINLLLWSFWGLKIEGKQNIPKSQGFILLLDRGNFLECLALEAAIPTKIYWAVSGLEHRHPIFRWILLKSGCFCLDSAIPDIEGFRLAFDVLKREEIISFYPPGLTRGIVLFCLRSGEDILPAVVLRQNKRPYFKVCFAAVCNFKEYQNTMVNIEVVEGIIRRIKGLIAELIPPAEAEKIC